MEEPQPLHIRSAVPALPVRGEFSRKSTESENPFPADFAPEKSLIFSKIRSIGRYAFSVSPEGLCSSPIQCISGIRLFRSAVRPTPGFLFRFPFLPQHSRFFPRQSGAHPLAGVAAVQALRTDTAVITLRMDHKALRITNRTAAPHPNPLLRLESLSSITQKELRSKRFHKGCGIKRGNQERKKIPGFAAHSRQNVV